jgi:hypothetical protein
LKSLNSSGNLLFLSKNHLHIQYQFFIIGLKTRSR